MSQMSVVPTEQWRWGIYEHFQRSARDWHFVYADHEVRRRLADRNRSFPLQKSKGNLEHGDHHVY